MKSFGHRRFTLHGVSHWVGFDVHDPNPYAEPGQASRPLEAGMVFTIEPGIYIAANSQGVDPKWWNIGVRIEDTILVTKDGSDCLSCAAPARGRGRREDGAVREEEVTADLGASPTRGRRHPEWPAQARAPQDDRRPA